MRVTFRINSDHGTPHTPICTGNPSLFEPHPLFEGGSELELESGFFNVVVDGAVGGGGGN